MQTDWNNANPGLVRFGSGKTSLWRGRQCSCLYVIAAVQHNASGRHSPGQWGGSGAAAGLHTLGSTMPRKADYCDLPPCNPQIWLHLISELSGTLCPLRSVKSHTLTLKLHLHLPPKTWKEACVFKQFLHSLYIKFSNPPALVCTAVPFSHGQDDGICFNPRVNSLPFPVGQFQVLRLWLWPVL